MTDSEPSQEPPAEQVTEPTVQVAAGPPVPAEGATGTFPPPAPSTWDVPSWVYLCIGGYALLAVLGLGLTLVAAASLPGGMPSRSAAGTSSAAPADSPSDPPDDTYSPTPEDTSPSPEDSYKDPATMDSESTDTTEFTEARIFPEDTVTADDGTTYTLEATGFFSACTDSGGSDTAALMRAHGCGNMLTADYANDTDGMFISTMVIPLTSTDDASAVQQDFNASDSPAFDELTVYCPQNAAYDQTICQGSADPTWRATYTHYHRYLIIAMTVLENGGDTPDSEQVRDAGAAVITEVETALDG